MHVDSKQIKIKFWEYSHKIKYECMELDKR